MTAQQNHKYAEMSTLEIHCIHNTKTKHNALLTYETKQIKETVKSKQTYQIT